MTLYKEKYERLVNFIKLHQNSDVKFYICAECEEPHAYQMDKKGGCICRGCGETRCWKCFKIVGFKSCYMCGKAYCNNCQIHLKFNFCNNSLCVTCANTYNVKKCFTCDKTTMFDIANKSWYEKTFVEVACEHTNKRQKNDN